MINEWITNQNEISKKSSNNYTTNHIYLHFVNNYQSSHPVIKC